MVVLVIALFTGMVAVALWAWVTVPGDRRFPVRFGNPPGFDGTVSKRIGLVMWLVLGAIVTTASLMAAQDPESDVGALPAVGTAFLAFLLLMEIVSIRRLLR